MNIRTIELLDTALKICVEFWNSPKARQGRWQLPITDDILSPLIQNGDVINEYIILSQLVEDGFLIKTRDDKFVSINGGGRIEHAGQYDITMKGCDFYKNGGYMMQHKLYLKEERKKLYVHISTIITAIAAVGILIWEIFKY